MNNQVDMRIPTTIVTGFLGSGKTTIIMGLIDRLQAAGQQVVYVKNEIGDLNVDTQLMTGLNIQAKELLNGCICCTLVGPFLSALNEIADSYQPHRIIIEASGAADPSAIALMVSNHPRLSRDGVISIIDVVNFEGYKDLSITAQRQAEFTDLLVFNKIEQVDIDRKRVVVGYVRELNTFSPIVEAPQGKLAVELAFGISSSELTELLNGSDAMQTHNHHLETDGIDSCHCQATQPLDRKSLQEFLESLSPTVFRVKGFVTLNDGVQQLVNKAGKRIRFTDLPSNLHLDQDLSQLVFIGFDVARLNTQLSHQLALCALPQ